MKNPGLYLPKFFKKQSYHNINDIPFELIGDQHYFVPIEFFRKLYIDDRQAFDQITTELVLRGGKFSISKKSVLFPDIKFSNNKLISTSPDTPKNAFKAIDYDLFNIRSFVKTFGIDSNSFFNYVPLDGFKVLNLSPNDIEILENILIEIGFDIYHPDIDLFRISDEKFIDNIPYVIKKDTEETIKDSGKVQYTTKDTTSDPKVAKIINIIKDNPLYDFIEVININDQSIKNIFKFEDIQRIGDLIIKNNQHVLRKLTQEQLNILLKEINEIILNYDLMATILVTLITSNPAIQSLDLPDLHYKTSPNAMLRGAYKENIYKFKDFTVGGAKRTFRTNGVGKLKIASFLNTVIEYTNIDFTRSRAIDGGDTIIPSQITDDDTTYLAYFMLEKYISKKHLTRIQSKLLRIQEINLLVTNIVDSETDIDIIFKKIKEQEDEIKSFDGQDLNNLDSYHLSIEEILTSANIDFILKKLNDPIDIISQPSNVLIRSGEELSNNLIQIILFYIDKINTFEKFDDKLGNNPFNLTDRELEIFNTRLISSEPKTLESVGELLGVTRERVRQIESKMRKKMNLKFKELSIGIYKAHLLKNGTPKIKEPSLRKYLIASKHPDYYYDKEFDLLFISDYKKMYKDIRKRVLLFFNKHEFLELNDLNHFMKDFKEEIEHEDLKNVIETIVDRYISKSNYIKKDDVFLKENISKQQMYYYIVDKFYSKDILELDNEESYNLFMKRLSHYAPKNITNDLIKRKKFDAIRSIEAILDRNNDKILKVDAHRYRKLDINRIPYSLIDDIYNFINKEILDNNFVSIIKIYRNFTHQIEELGYSSKTIYNLLKLLYDDEFAFSGKTTLRIFEKDVEKLSTQETILTILDKNNGQMKIKELAEEMGVESHTIYQQAEIDSFVIKDNIVYVVDKEALFSESSTNAIKNLFEKMMNSKGYVPIKQIYDELKFNIKVNQELRENNYTTVNDFTHLLKSMFPETQGHTRILFDKDSNQDYFDIFIKEIGEVETYHRKDFLTAGEGLGLAEPSINLHLKSFIEEGKLVPVNSDFLILPSRLDLNNDLLGRIDKFLQEKFDKNEYLSLTNLRIEFAHLPRIQDYPWTIELMNFLSTKVLNYRKVDMQSFQYTSDPMIITQNNSDLTYKGIIISEMKNFKGNMTDENILDYLKQRGLLRPHVKSVYNWFFSKGVFDRNDIGRIYLVEEG